MRKGFIGPIGDDLPSVIALLLALGMFFTAVIYSFNMYNQKLSDMETLKGSIEIGRVLMDRGYMLDSDIATSPKSKVLITSDYVKNSYGLEYEVFFGKGNKCTEQPSFRFQYLVSVFRDTGPQLDILVLCTWRK